MSAKRFQINDSYTLSGGKSVYLQPTHKMKPIKDKPNLAFNPEIHVMIPNPNGKGYIQKLKSEIK